MRGIISGSRLHRRLVDTLYIDAMVLADEARSYFDEAGRLERESLDPMARVSFSCESLKVTTRLMHIIAWLLTQRAVEAGELRAADALDPSRRLGPAPVSETGAVSAMPERARGLIAASTELYRRVARLDDSQAVTEVASAVRSMHARLALSF
jgi:regulator of CtrA degradation